MNKLLLSLVLLSLPPFLHAQSWVKLTDFPADARDDGACFTIDNTAYCGGGVKPFIPLGDFHAFDLITESWSTTAPIPAGEERQYACAFAYDSLGYLFGGFSNTFLNDLWQYNPKTNSWLEKTALPGAPRSGAASFVIDSLVYIVGGKNQGNEALDEVWAYNMRTDSWQQKNDLPFGPRWRSGACALNGKGYLAFGLDDTLLYTNRLYEYNPQNDTWTLLTSHPEGGRNYTMLYGMNGKLFSVGGNDSALNYLNEVWEFDLNTKLWDQLPDLPGEGRRGGMSFQSAAALYYTTGLADSSERLVETLKLTDPTYLNETKSSSFIKIYPNPTTTFFKVDLKDFKTEKLSIEVYSTHGQSIYSKEELQERILQIDCANWPKGIYLLRIANQMQSFSKRIMVK